MKLGTETGSIVNHIMSRAVIGEPEPVIGMGVTILMWTDRHAATITAWDGKILTIQEDTATRTDKNGLSEDQEYTYSPNPKGTIHHYKKDRRGLWVACNFNPDTKRWKACGGSGLRIGTREEYYDPSF